MTVQGGLPIPITTPAHGTAYDIAGQGKASDAAMWQAFNVACRMGRSHPRRAPPRPEPVFRHPGAVRAPSSHLGNSS